MKSIISTPVTRQNQLVGRRVAVPAGGCHFAAEVIDTRRRYGHLDVLVRPLRGAGEMWVQLDRLVLAGQCM